MSKLGGSIHFNRYGIFPFLTVLGSGLGRFVLVLMLRVWMGKPHRYMMFWAGWLDGNGWDCVTASYFAIFMYYTMEGHVSAVNCGRLISRYQLYIACGSAGKCSFVIQLLFGCVRLSRQVGI